jgi:hypothetical protein
VKEGRLTDGVSPSARILMAAGAWFTDLIGLHAVFGAFVVGAAMPRGVVAQVSLAEFSRSPLPCCSPCFHLLRAEHADQAAERQLSLAALRRGAAGLHFRQGHCVLVGSPRDRHPTRGAWDWDVDECPRSNGLIIINIGLQRGIFSDELFATLVIMAVVTTLLLSVFEARGSFRPESLRRESQPEFEEPHR